MTTQSLKLKSAMSAEEPLRIGVMETATEDGVFDLRTPLLKQGITSDLRAKTDHLTVTLKVYASGGENEMHSHNAEDHTFVVLSEQATFHVGSEENMFQSSGEGNLVMLRAGAKIAGPKQVEKDLAFLSERVELPGMSFPDDCR